MLGFPRLEADESVEGGCVRQRGGRSFGMIYLREEEGREGGEEGTPCVIKDKSKKKKKNKSRG